MNSAFVTYCRCESEVYLEGLAVQDLVLEEHNRVWIPNGGLQQSS